MKDQQYETFQSIFGVSGDSINWRTVALLASSIFLSSIIKFHGSFFWILVISAVQILLPVAFFKYKKESDVKSFLLIIPVAGALIISLTSMSSLKFLIMLFISNLLSLYAIYITWYYLAVKKLTEKAYSEFYAYMALGIFFSAILASVANYMVISIILDSYARFQWTGVIIKPVVFAAILVCGDKLLNLYQDTAAYAGATAAAPVTTGNISTSEFSIKNKTELRTLVSKILPADYRVKETKALLPELFQLEFGKGDESIMLYWFTSPEKAPAACEASKKTLGEFFAGSEYTEKGIWKHYYKGGDRDGGMTELVSTGKNAFFIQSMDAGKAGEDEIISKLINDLKSDEIQRSFMAGRPSQAATPTGPLVGAVALALMAVLTLLSRDTLYTFGVSSRVDLPNIIPAILFAVMAFFCYRGKIKYSYIFIFFTTCITFIQIILASAFNMSLSGGEAVLFNTLLGILFLVIIPMRSVDFGYDDWKEFLSSINRR